jgi:hypothetical protein
MLKLPEDILSYVKVMLGTPSLPSNGSTFGNNAKKTVLTGKFS